MPRVASEPSVVANHRPPESVRASDKTPEQPFDALLNADAPASNSAPPRTRPPERETTQPKRSEPTAPAARPAPDEKPVMKTERAQEATAPQSPVVENAPVVDDAQLNFEIAKPKIAVADAAPIADVVATDAAETDKADADKTIEVEASVLPIDAPQPPPAPHLEQPTPVVAAVAPLPQTVTEPAAATGDAPAPPVIKADTPDASPAAPLTPQNDAVADAETARGTDARAAAPAKPKIAKAESEGADETEPAPPVHGKPRAPIAKSEAAPSHMTDGPEAPPLPAAEKDLQHVKQAPTDQPSPRQVPAERPALPPEAAPRATEARETAKPAVEPAPNFNPSAPGLTVASAHAAASSPLARAVLPAPAVPIAGLAVEIATQARAGRNRFEIRLDPPELGRIDVRLDVDRHGAATTRLVVDRVETLDLLRRDAAQLERALQDAGLKTGDNSLQFTLRDQAFGRQQDAPSANIVIPDADLPAIETTQHGGRSPGLGSGVDIRV